MNNKETQIQLPKSAIPHLGRFYGYSIICFEICAFIYYIIFLEDSDEGYDILLITWGWCLQMFYTPINALLYAAICHLKIIPYGFMSKSITFIEILIFYIIFFFPIYHNISSDHPLGNCRIIAEAIIVVLILAILSRLILRNYWEKRDARIRKSIPEDFNPLKNKKYILYSLVKIIFLLSFVIVSLHYGLYGSW